jgi:rare lipoprotein A (peptidoglycan hydrolase)
MRAALALAAALLLATGLPAEAGGWHLHDYATWFGPGLYGKRTACGHKLTRRLAGVAHRTLPCGTLIAIRHKGYRVRVPVVDRGPWGVPGLDIDMTARTSCWQLTGGRPKDCSSKWIDWKVVR